MKREKQRPTERPGMHDSVIREHPAFGCVEVTRWTGGRDTLFRSNIEVGTCISIRVHEASEVRGLQHSRHHPERTIVHFTMTEAQWAQFVSSIGHGVGVPCTLLHRQTGPMVELPKIDDHSAAEDRGRHIAEMTARHLAHLKEAMAIVDRLAAPGAKVSKADIAELRAKLQSGVSQAPSNFQFAADMVTEHLAEVAHEAKLELHSYRTSLGLPDAVQPKLIEHDE